MAVVNYKNICAMAQRRIFFKTDVYKVVLDYTEDLHYNAGAEVEAVCTMNVFRIADTAGMKDCIIEDPETHDRKQESRFFDDLIVPRMHFEISNYTPRDKVLKQIRQKLSTVDRDFCFHDSGNGFELPDWLIDGIIPAPAKRRRKV